MRPVVGSYGLVSFPQLSVLVYFRLSKYPSAGAVKPYSPLGAEFPSTWCGLIIWRRFVCWKMLSRNLGALSVPSSDTTLNLVNILPKISN